MHVKVCTLSDKIQNRCFLHMYLNAFSEFIFFWAEVPVYWDSSRVSIFSCKIRRKLLKIQSEGLKIPYDPKFLKIFSHNINCGIFVFKKLLRRIKVFFFTTKIHVITRRMLFNFGLIIRKIANSHLYKIKFSWFRC